MLELKFVCPCGAQVEYPKSSDFSVCSGCCAIYRWHRGDLSELTEEQIRCDLSSDNAAFILRILDDLRARRHRIKMNEEIRKRMTEELKGKTIESFEWCPPQDGVRGYWVMTFSGGGEMCVVTMAELERENLSLQNPVSA